MGVEGGELGMGSNGVKGSVVALVALVFPNVDFSAEEQVSMVS